MYRRTSLIALGVSYLLMLTILLSQSLASGGHIQIEWVMVLLLTLSVQLTLCLEIERNLVSMGRVLALATGMWWTAYLGLSLHWIPLGRTEPAITAAGLLAGSLLAWRRPSVAGCLLIGLGIVLFGLLARHLSGLDSGSALVLLLLLPLPSMVSGAMLLRPNGGCRPQLSA